MEWDSIIPLISVLVFAVGLPLLLRAKKKGSSEKEDELLSHLQGTGVKAHLLEDGGDQDKMWRKRSFGEKSEGAIGIDDRNMDSIHIVGVSSQYGTSYYLDCLVRSPSEMGRRDAQKTRMIKKKSPPVWGKVVDIEWRGDEQLAQRLNFDYQLKYKLLHPDSNPLKGSISIFPEPKHGYTRIRTKYQLPSPDLFQAWDAIAKHVKSWA